MKFEFELETITPLFMAGTDGRIPELRAPSIKGALRFWWRAMNGHLSIDELREKEAEIFGGSGEKQGKSVFSIRIKDINNKAPGKNIKQDYDLKFSYNKSAKTLSGNDAGIGYLFYSVMLGNGRSYFKDGKKFEIEFQSQSIPILQEVLAAFWALIFLGGLGSRARRCAGNFFVNNDKDQTDILQKTGLDFFPKSENTAALIKWVIENYEKASAIINKNSENKDTDFISEYTNLSFSRIIISNNSFCNWKDALNDIGEKYSKFRTDNKHNVFGTSVFGLPRKYIKTTDNKNYNRRSSPLLFKILKSNNKFYWMILRFSGEFLPERIVLKNRTVTKKPDYSQIDKFWNKIKKDNIEEILFMPDSLKNLKKEIVNDLKTDSVILFGSRVRGDFRDKSDIDIAVNTEQSVELSIIINRIDLVNLNSASKQLKKKIENEGIEI